MFQGILDTISKIYVQFLIGISLLSAGIGFFIGNFWGTYQSKKIVKKIKAELLQINLNLEQVKNILGDGENDRNEGKP